MSLPKVLYVIYNTDTIEFITEDYETAINFVKFRITNNRGEVIEDYKDSYKGIKVTDPTEIKNLLYDYDFCRGEEYGGIVFSNTEFELLSEYMANMNSTIRYGAESYIVKKLKYFKLDDEDRELILKALSIIVNKINLIEEGPMDSDEDEELYDEDNVYYLDKIVQDFFNDMISPNPYAY